MCVDNTGVWEGLGLSGPILPLVSHGPWANKAPGLSMSLQEGCS